jgi:transposase
MFTADSQLSMHLEHEPGKQMFLDFAGDKPHLLDPKTGVEHPVELFVAVFPASGLIYLEAVESQKIEDPVCAIRHALEYAGGVPMILVPDNLKAAVTKPDRYEADINQSFEDFGRYYGCVVIPARSAKPRDKALVEAAVNLVYTRENDWNSARYWSQAMKTMTHHAE